MRGFYVVYDVEMSRIGFAALADSIKDEPCDEACAGGIATTPLTGGFPWWGWLIIGIVLVIIIVVIIVVVCCYRSENSK